jgi:hypothetical protein
MKKLIFINLIAILTFTAVIPTAAQFGDLKKIFKDKTKKKQPKSDETTNTNTAVERPNGAI